MDELRSVLSSDDVAKFEQCWDTLDPDRTGYIGVWKLPSLMERSKRLSHDIIQSVCICLSAFGLPALTF